jgi:molybdenum cofactor cytidylyltransferase
MGNTAVIVLAAGASTRLGQPKQLLDFGGKALLQHILEQCKPLHFSARFLILGAYSSDIQQNTNTFDFQILQNEHWEAGMASSLHIGIQAAIAHPSAPEQVLVLLADQPFVSTALLQALLDTHQSERPPITASQYGTTKGVPAIFSKTVFPELLQLQGDRGANRLIRQYEAQVAILPFEAGSIDMDTREDYQQWRDALNPNQ